MVSHLDHTEGRQSSGVNRDSVLFQKIIGKLRELGPWKPDERTERKLVWLTSFVMFEEKRFALLSRSERKGSADELAETSRKLLGLERAQAFGVWLVKCLRETGVTADEGGVLDGQEGFKNEAIVHI